MAENKYKWLDMAIDIQEKIIPEIKELCLSCVREIQPDAALLMAEYIYRDYLENVERYEWMKPFGEMLEKFTREEKPKAIGVLFEIIETCGEKCEIGDLVTITNRWSIKERTKDLLEVFFK